MARNNGMKINGFTMLEMLVVLGIILLITGATIATFNTQSIDKQLQAESSKLADVFDLARKKASSADAATTCSTSNWKFTGYRVVVTAPSSYILQLCCDATADGVGCTNPQQIASYVINNSSITFQNSGTPRFKPLSEGADLTGLASGAITVKSSINKCIDVTVSSTGIVDTTTPVSC